MLEFTRTAIVTGANSGLGFETTKAFARQDIKVIMACRNNKKAVIAREQILKEIPSANLKIMILDLNSFESVRNFAAEYKSRYEALHILVNNAGFMANKFELSTDGFETQWSANFLGHFLLTGLLLETLKNTENARIVSLSSLAHYYAKLDLDTINEKQNYSAFLTYANTKLACLMYSYQLNKRLTNANVNIISTAAHPGISITNISNKLPNYLKFLQQKFGHFIFSDTKNGAESTLFAALDLSVKGASYYGPSGLFEIKGKQTKVSSNKFSKSEKQAEKIWNFAEKATGFVYDFG